MSVELVFPTFISATPEMIDFGGTLTPANGGAEQRVNRLGNRFSMAMAVDFDTDEEARRFVQDLRLAQTQGALMRFIQVGLNVGAPGSPLVNGAVSGGTSLPVKGLTPGYAIRYGQFFSIIVGGRRYLYSAAAAVAADASGNATLTIDPMLRTALVGDEVIEIAKPMIEGAVIGDKVQWEHAANSYEPFLFAVREMR